ncbi:MAG: hypothetical protein BGO67_12660 [Alphaproteobacteria bacterium 41-28]|nr:MAG: hypothetical protein BGO67_12660 [Alphaproteobacteria bacterium 41-28]
MKKRLLTFVLLAGISFAVHPLYAADQTTESKVPVAHKEQKDVHRTLWGTKKSPYVRKVLITLEEKKAPYKLEGILPEKLLKATNQKIPEVFLKISPFGKIPAYQEINMTDHKEFSITESSVIMNYLNETIEETPLRPNDPKGNARVSWFMTYGNDVVAPLTYKILFEKVIKPNFLKEKTDTALVDNILKEELPVVLDFLEKTLADNRAWIADTKNFSLADITIASHLITLSTTGLNLDETIGEKRPNLLQYMRKILNRPSVKKALG